MLVLQGELDDHVAFRHVAAGNVEDGEVLPFGLNIVLKLIFVLRGTAEATTTHQSCS